MFTAYIKVKFMPTAAKKYNRNSKYTVVKLLCYTSLDHCTQNSSTTAQPTVWTQWLFAVKGCPVCYRVCKSIPGPYPRDTSSTSLRYNNRKCLQTQPNALSFPLGWKNRNFAPVENQWLNRMSEKIFFSFCFCFFTTSLDN